eukprot:5020380-Amphidinium_carterae.1
MSHSRFGLWILSFSGEELVYKTCGNGFQILQQVCKILRSKRLRINSTSVQTKKWRNHAVIVQSLHYDVTTLPLTARPKLYELRNHNYTTSAKRQKTQSKKD